MYQRRYITGVSNRTPTGGGKNAAICMIKNDGTEFKELAHGEYTNINVTSDKIFFSDYRTGEVYYTSTTNPGEISLFSPGTDK